MQNNFHKKVGIIYVEDKPMFLIDIKDIDNETSYNYLKNECKNNYDNFVANKKKVDKDFKDNLTEQVNIIAKSLKTYVNK